MKLFWFFIWLLFVPVLFIASIIAYISYLMLKNEEVYKVFIFYIDYFSIPGDIIFKTRWNTDDIE